MSDSTPEVFGGLDESTVISRYMSFAAFASILQTKKLFFNTVCQFEDRNEGASTMIDALAKTKAALMLDVAMSGSWPLSAPTPEQQALREV